MTERSKADQRRDVFRTWYKWLQTKPIVTPQILLEYFECCAKDYQAIGGDATFMYEVEKLYAEADRQQRIIDGIEDRLGNKLNA